MILAMYFLLYISLPYVPLSAYNKKTIYKVVRGPFVYILITFKIELSSKILSKILAISRSDLSKALDLEVSRLAYGKACQMF